MRNWLWLLSIVLGAICCTHLENGGDTFGAPGQAGTANAGTVTVQAGAPSAGGSTNPMGTGGTTPDATGGTGEGAGAASNAGAGPGCTDGSGFDGVGCYRCTPSDTVTLENACSDVTCTRFDNGARLVLNDGKLPELPAATGAGNGGTSGGGTSGGGTGGGGTGGGGNGGAGGSGGSPVGFACDSLGSRGTLIYVTGSTASKPFLQRIAQQLSTQEEPVYVVYTPTGSCTGVDAVVNGTPMKTGAAPNPASAIYWDSSASNGKSCDLPQGGVLADLGASDVFAQSCPGFELTNLESLGIRDAHGPIQIMTFAVPANSALHEISQQAAYLVFGFGKDARVRDVNGTSIWDDEKMIQQRSPTSGTQAMIAAAIGVPPGRWKGQPNKTSDDVVAALLTAAKSQETASKALGILAADYIDTNNLRAQIRALAYQDSEQGCAVTPDSSESSKDKLNVRDGHYPIWGPLHLMYKVDGKGNPVNTAIRQPLLDVIGYLAGTKTLPNGVSLFDLYATSGLVPECAMHVSRSQDGGAIAPFHPESPCSCLFDLKTTGATKCRKCKVQGDCKAGESCSLAGYCEEE